MKMNVKKGWSYDMPTRNSNSTKQEVTIKLWTTLSALCCCQQRAIKNLDAWHVTVLLCLISLGYIIMLLVCYFRCVLPTRNAGRRWGFRFYWNMWIPTFRWHVLPLSSWSDLAVDLFREIGILRCTAVRTRNVALWIFVQSHRSTLRTAWSCSFDVRGVLRAYQAGFLSWTFVLITWFSGSGWHQSFALGTEASLMRSLILQ